MVGFTFLAGYFDKLQRGAPQGRPSLGRESCRKVMIFQRSPRENSQIYGKPMENLWKIDEQPMISLEKQFADG